MENERMESMQNLEPVDAEPIKRKPFWKNTRGIALFVAFVLIFSCIGGYTIAYLQEQAKEAVTNDFRLAEVAVMQDLDYTDGIRFKNHGEMNEDGSFNNVAVYIRVAVIGNWVLKTDPTKICASPRPERGKDYCLEAGGNKDAITRDDEGNLQYNDMGYYKSDTTKSWFVVFENGITYYYYKEPVNPQGTTCPLTDRYVIDNTGAPSSDYECRVEFAVQAVQAVGGVMEDTNNDGKDDKFIPAVIKAWGADVQVDANGVLSAKSK